MRGSAGSGARPVRLIGRGAQLYVRTARHAYAAYLRPRCGCVPGLLLVDELLFDHTTDPGEAYNLAYDEAHAATRRRMLATVTRDWRVLLVGETEPDRDARRGLVLQLLRCYNATRRCPQELGELGGSHPRRHRST